MFVVTLKECFNIDIISGAQFCIAFCAVADTFVLNGYSRFTCKLAVKTACGLLVYQILFCVSVCNSGRTERCK